MTGEGFEPRPRTLRLDTVTGPERTVVIVRGEIDMHTASQLSAVVQLACVNSEVVELDLAELEFLDSTGLGVIAGALDLLDRSGGRLELRNVPPMVMRLLQMTDMARLLTIISERPRRSGR